MLDGSNGNHLLIGNSMTICDDSSGDNSAIGGIEPTIQNLELDQKFNDAQSYLIESGEISSDGGGKSKWLFILLFTNLNVNIPHFLKLLMFLEMCLLQWKTLRFEIN